MPNRAGPMFVSGWSDFVGMLLPLREHEIVGVYLSEFLLGLGHGLTRRGRDLFLAGAGRSRRARHLVDSQRANGCGEAQRVKLAKELSKRATGRTLYVLDEPTCWVR